MHVEAEPQAKGRKIKALAAELSLTRPVCMTSPAGRLCRKCQLIDLDALFQNSQHPKERSGSRWR